MALTDCCFGKAFQHSPEEKKKKKKVREADGWGWEESKRGGWIQKWKRQNTWERQRDGEKVELNTRKEWMWRRSESFECGVKLDRFEGDQQTERLWVKLERVKTHERDVKKHERPIKCRIRIATRGAKRDETRSRKTTQSRMIIASDVLWSLVMCDADDRTSEWVLIRHAFWTPNLL